MRFSDNAMCAILLCSYLGIRSDDAIKPFSLGEWNDFLDKIIEMKEEPCAILRKDFDIANQMKYTDAYAERIRNLVSRGAGVAFELDDLEKKGIQVITLFDADYPILLRRKLKKKMPPVLFYTGDIRLSKKVGIAVVGSRNVNQEGIEFTKKLVEKAAGEKLVIYSGGAKGVDTISEMTAINAGSAVVSFVADSLLTKIKKKEVLDNIMAGRLLLISDVKPDAGFSAARAMNRNKYIYASSYGAFVVSSDYNKGGTWGGATEAMRNGLSKTFVWDHKEYLGNQKLIEKGAIPYELSSEKIYTVITKDEKRFDQLNLFNLSQTDIDAERKREDNTIISENRESKDLYDIVKVYIKDHMNKGMSIEEASLEFNVAKGQMAVWLKRLCKENLIKCDEGIYSKI